MPNVCADDVALQSNLHSPNAPLPKHEANAPSDPLTSARPRGRTRDSCIGDAEDEAFVMLVVHSQFDKNVGDLVARTWWS